MRILKLSTLPLVLVVSAGCASSVPIDNPGTVPASTAPMMSSTVPQWTATLNPVQERTSEVRSSTTNRARGNFAMTAGDVQGWSNVTLNFSANTSGVSGSSAAWAILPGSCGSGGAPVLPLSAFPMLEIGGSGTAQVATRIHLNFPNSGSYHVNIYRGGNVMSSDTRSVAGVIACGNLKYKL